MAHQTNKQRGSKTTTIVAVATEAVLLAAANPQRKSILIQNQGAGILYVSESSSITAATGVEIAADGSLTDNDSTDAWYGISASASTVAVIVVV